MAFENGYNMFNYCEELFAKYKEDKLIFYKALQILSVNSSIKLTSLSSLHDRTFLAFHSI